VIVRPSGTEPFVRVFSEAKSEKEAKGLADEYEKIANG
jgi:phosphomannomutase